MKQAIFLFLLLVPVFSRADSLSVTGSNLEDNYMTSLASTTNYGGADTLRDSQTFSQVQAFLIRIGQTYINANLPSGAVIDSGALYVTCKLAPTSTASVRVYKCLRQWSEASSNWTNWFETGEGDQAWTTAGAQNTTNDQAGSYESAVSVSSSSANTEFRWSIGQATAQSWSTASNGLVVRTITLNTGITWYSSEAGSHQPRMVLYYQISGEPLARMSEGNVRARMRQGRVARRGP